MNEFFIRAAVREDLPTVVKFFAGDLVAGSRERLTDPLAESYLRAFEAISADPNHHLLVVEQDGAVIGTFQLSFIPNMTYQSGWRAQIEGVFVSADRRNQGIGTAMMEWAVARSRERGCCLVQLTSSRERIQAHRFYEGLGFDFSHLGAKLDLNDGRPIIYDPGPCL
jgi:GNAT superfamily N-acetyltransferase